MVSGAIWDSLVRGCGRRQHRLMMMMMILGREHGMSLVEYSFVL